MSSGGATSISDGLALAQRELTPEPWAHAFAGTCVASGDVATLHAAAASGPPLATKRLGSCVAVRVAP